jgi:hypothetical protein
MRVDWKKWLPFSPSKRTPRASLRAFFTGSKRAHGCDLDAGAGLAGITGEVGGEILRGGDAGVAEQGAAEELPEALVFRVLGIGAEGVGLGPELVLTGSEVVVLAALGLAVVPGPEGEGAVVGEEDLAVMFEVVPHLRGWSRRRRGPCRAASPR